MDTKTELMLRRKAIRLFLRGIKPRFILNKISKGRTWFYKWKERFEHFGWSGLKSSSRQPERSPQAYSKQARTVVKRLRRVMQKRSVGLIGAKTIRQEIRQQRLLRPVPSVATINRWLKEDGLIETRPAKSQIAYYPELSLTTDVVLHLMDWIARYIQGGEKVFAFHTVDFETRALAQTISGDKSTLSLRHHALNAWQTLGLPHMLQLDNDSAATGGEKTPRRFGSFVRLCLYFGIEPIFIPPAEPKRNYLVESLNGLWAKSFWDRKNFRSLKEVFRQSYKFTDWYMFKYQPPALEGLTPAKAHRKVERVYLTRKQIRALPQVLPITAGRIHFIRRVSADGEISFLGETWKVGKRFAHKYVWATVITHCRRLEIYYQRSERGVSRLIKRCHYEIPERVRRLRPEFWR